MKNCQKPQPELKTYALQFIHKYGNGYALVNANSPNLAESIFKTLTKCDVSEITYIQELRWFGQEMQLVTEGRIVTYGKSLYDLAVYNGFKGTLEEFMESMKGPKGDTGEQGPQGPQGPPGKDGLDGKDGTDGKDGKDGVDGKSALVVTVTLDGTYSADTTFAEMLTAWNNGLDVIVYYSDAVYQVSWIDDGGAWFFRTDKTNAGPYIDYFAVDGTDDSWTKNTYNLLTRLTFDNTPTLNSNNPVKSGGVYTALQPKLECYELIDDTNLLPIWQAYMGGGTISDQQAFNTACEYLLNKMYDVENEVVFLINGIICIKSFFEGFPVTSPNYNPIDSCSVYFELTDKYQGAVSYNVIGVSRDSNGVTWGWYGNNDEIELLPAKTLNTYCPIIEDTRSSAVAAITGVAPFSTLVDGQKILLKLKFSTVSGATLELTLSDGITTTGKKTMKIAYNSSFVNVGTGYTYIAGCYIPLIYDGTNGYWRVTGRENDTTYSSMTQANINSGNATTNTVSAKLIHDNAYIVEKSYSSGSLKANKMYDFGTVSTALTIPSLDATNDLVSNALNFYAIRFIAGADNLSITFPTGVIVDDTPTINTGDYVEIMINKYGTNFYASIKVWQAQ